MPQATQLLGLAFFIGIDADNSDDGNGIDYGNQRNSGDDLVVMIMMIVMVMVMKVLIVIKILGNDDDDDFHHNGLDYDCIVFHCSL